MNEVAKKITLEINQRGPISFARFMEVALYCPVFGYYAKETDTVGRHGDFYTSVSVGSLFGELLAWQFAEWLEEIHTTEALRIVEAGAHHGQLAKDILDWLRIWRPLLFERFEYWIVEPSGQRRELQGAALSRFVGKVHWASHIEELRTSPGSGVCGIIFSNELLDAFPVHRLRWDASQKSWREWGVTSEAGRFVWTPMESRDCKSIPEDLLPHLPDRFILDVSPTAVEWWRAAADMLTCGKLLTIDYGLTAEEILAPERSCGTLRAYRKHHLSDDLLADPGEQDLTAHVDFSTIQDAGEAAGLRTEVFLTQEQFLTQIAARSVKTQSGSKEPLQVHSRQFLTLTHPEHLGSRFRALIQARPPC